MTIGDCIPDLSDNKLESLHANAVRLKDSGCAIQRQQAEKLLPLLGFALEGDAPRAHRHADETPRATARGQKVST